MTEFADRLWRLEIGVEVSSRYHEWRRQTLEFLVNCVRATSLIGAIIAFLAVTAVDEPWVAAAAIASATIGVVTLIDLVFQIDGRARLHTDLYRRFKSLQADISKNRGQAGEYLGDWESESQIIRKDEPPVFWAIYARCWNQTIAKHDADWTYMRHIEPWQGLMKSIWRFRPESFPFARRPL